MRSLRRSSGWCGVRQRDLCFYLAKYPYKNFVFKNGRALDPGGNLLQPDLLVGNLLPVGLILDNVLEVIDDVTGTRRLLSSLNHCWSSVS
jgi:hypothetical protein